MTDISNVVKVTIGATPVFPKGKGFGLLNIIGNSTSLPQGDRIRFYTDITSVGVDFSANSEEYKAAAIFFAQNPRPTTLAISRRFTAATAGELLGGPGASQVISDYTSITTGAFAISVDGVVKQVTAIDFTGAANMNAIAAIIQTRLQIVAASATCVWTGKQFLLHSGTTGPTSTLSFGSAPAGGVDISTLIDIDAVGGAKVTAGSAVETVTQALNNLLLIDSSWYGYTFVKGLTDNEITIAAAWAPTANRVYGYTVSNPNNLDGSSTAGVGYLIKATGNKRALGLWSNIDDYGHVSAMARLFATDYRATNSAITLKFKVLPNITTLTLTETQRLALVKFNLNYYTNFGDSPMLAEGVMADGTFADQTHALDWLQNTIETNVFGFLYTTPRVAQTDKGVAQVVQRVDKSWDQAANAGLIAAGEWQGNDFGAIKQGDFLAKGYYSYAPPVASQSQADRAARLAPPITTVGLGSGAIHGVSVEVTFQP